jgi:hypothetical protein
MLLRLRDEVISAADALQDVYRNLPIRWRMAVHADCAPTI